MGGHLIIDNIKITEEQFLWFLDNKDSLKRSKLYNIVEISEFCEDFTISSLDSSSIIRYMAKRSLCVDGVTSYYEANQSITLTDKVKIKMLTDLRNYKISDILI